MAFLRQLPPGLLVLAAADCRSCCFPLYAGLTVVRGAFCNYCFVGFFQYKATG